MTTIIPNDQLIFARPDEAKGKTDSGFLVQKGVFSAEKFAEVVATGAKVKGYKPGDRIIYREYATSEVTVDGVKHILLDQQDILGKLIEAEG